MDYVKLFYWLTVAENAKVLFIVMLSLFTLIGVISGMFYLIEEKGMGWIKWSWPLAILSWALYIGTPDRKEALLIIAGGSTLNYLVNDTIGKKNP